MREDLLVLDAADAAWHLAVLELVEKLVQHRGWRLDPSVPVVKRRLAEYVSRVSGRADATTQPTSGLMADSEMDTTEAAALLGITPAAVRKRCERGQFSGVARKHLGRWWIPAADIEAELEERIA